jgi:hypothetical protein
MGGMGSGMSPRERLLAVLGGRKPDRVPWFGDLDYWATALEARGQKTPGFKRDREYIEWHRSLGVGFYLQGSFPFSETHEGCVVTEWREGSARRRRIETPLGSLEEEWRSLPDSYSEAPVRRLVRSPRDLPALRFYYERASYEPDCVFVASRREQVGDMGIVLAYLPRSPFMHLTVVDAGIEAVVECAADAPAELEETLAAMARAHDRAAEVALRCPAEALMIPENLSSEVVGRSFFRRHVEPWQRRWVARIREAGKVSFVHMDGSLRGLLAEVGAVGFDVLEALTPAPVGDLAVEDWAGVAGGSLSVLWGGLPGSYFTAHVTDEEFERHVRAVLAVMRSSPRYVLGVADQVPPDALERRVAAVRDLVEGYG